jgi:hypothetical protein
MLPDALHTPLVTPYRSTGDALLARLTGTRPICNNHDEDVNAQNEAAARGTNVTQSVCRSGQLMGSLDAGYLAV